MYKFRVVLHVVKLCGLLEPLVEVVGEVAWFSDASTEWAGVFLVIYFM